VTVTVEPTLTPTPTATPEMGAASISPVFSDGFEREDLASWTAVDGLVVQPGEWFSASHAARASSAGSAAYALRACLNI
jgi:hypothetical protein